MTTMKSNDSILENLSPQFQNSGGIIKDYPEEKLLLLWPAGFTKSSVEGGYNRQHIHGFLFYKAAEEFREHETAPFHKRDYHLELKHTPENPHDSNAIQIIFRADCHRLQQIDGFELGFIPARINKKVLKNMHKIKRLYIHSVTNKAHDKYHLVTVAIDYSPKVTTKDDILLDRFVELDL